ncbi:MAG: DUF4376 domain-containing protein, partial [Gammaproteobacteria bacterium]|nr:DUF4376 domain-containing protein [Gammaproteobacteria bacterium]NIW44378.1 DUF4376 domain-containing protein [Gammaproteobacteria bacterium]NIX01514.1 DUF4376 domain-containing protein [Phycisphaerae bacterium]
MNYQLDENGRVIASSNGRPQEGMVRIDAPKPEGQHLWDGEKWVPDLDKPAILASYRYEREIEGITTNGAEIRTDRETQAVLLGARTKAKEDSNYTTMWKAVNGFVELTAPEIIAVADAVHDHVQKCFNAESVVDLNACETEEEIKAAFDAAYN